MDNASESIRPSDTLYAATNIDIIYVNQALFQFKQELGRGPFGLVYLYESETGYQLVSKIFKEEVTMQNDFQSLGFSKIPQQIEMMSMSEIGFDFA